MKKWLALVLTLFFTLSLSPVLSAENQRQESKVSGHTLMAKAKKKTAKKKKKKKKKRRTNLSLAFIRQFGNNTV